MHLKTVAERNTRGDASAFCSAGWGALCSWSPALASISLTARTSGLGDGPTDPRDGEFVQCWAIDGLPPRWIVGALAALVAARTQLPSGTALPALPLPTLRGTDWTPRHQAKGHEIGSLIERAQHQLMGLELGGLVVPF